MLSVSLASRHAPPRGEELAPLRLRIRWPGPTPCGAGDNFFIGAWIPSRPLGVEWAGERPPMTHVSGRNWILASATEPRQGMGLVHRDDSGKGIAFRGYVLPDVHSYSHTKAIGKCWLDTTSPRNGVFSAAVISHDGSSLALATDMLGIGTLYWRQLGELVLFATNPRYLACPGDAADLLAWRYVVQASWIGSDRSLTAGVERVPAGCTLTFTGGPRPVLSPPAWRSLPGGLDPIDSRSLREVERVFQQALDRCLGLRRGSIMLPLSSGFDSRRILAGLIRRKAAFTAVTYRSLQQGYRDLDARFAGQMARDLGFPHLVVDADDAQYPIDDASRRTLVDGESDEHTWCLRVHSALPGGCDVSLDGIAGDVLGDPVGWLRHTGLAVGGRAAEEEIESIASHAIRRDFDAVLDPAAWPTPGELRENLRSYLSGLLPRSNLGELAFLLLRQRRNIALWSQQLAPPGVVPLYPYLDHDYLCTVLSFSSEDKHRTKLQRSTLREFWPEFYRYPGNRDVPPDMPAGSPAREHRRALNCVKRLWRELDEANAMPQLRGLLTRRARLALAASRAVPPLAIRWTWFLQSLMELASRQARRAPVWEAGKTP